MPAPFTRNIDEPDEVIEADKIISEIVSLGGISLAHDIHQPGFRWSEHIKPVVGTEWCESRHIGYALRGRLQIVMRDGAEFDCRPGDLMDIPPGHDAWVLGDEPFEMLAWVGSTTWLSPLQTLKERVLVTLLFTDIVDSTGVAQRVGDRRWTELLNAHNQMMSDTIDRYRGQLAKLTGDGILAVFDGAARAVRCASACRQAAHDLGLTIRAAVHTGEIEVTGEELHGLAVHEASRLMHHARPGEVLVSDVTVSFARDARLSFEDRGEFDLRGVDQAIRAFALLE
jgi:class 3 adenylate cyclase